MSDITWAELSEGEQQVLKMMPIVFWQDSGYEDYEHHKTAILSLNQRGLVIHSMTRYSITDAGRAVLAQADSAKPTTITVREYYRKNYILKVAKKECTVSVPGYAGSWVEDVEGVGGMYLVKFQDYEGPHSFNFLPDDLLTVEWLPQQADAKPDSESTGAKNAQVEAGDSLPPVTQEEINAYLKSQGQDPETLADAFRPAIEKVIRERQKILGELVAPVAKEEKRGLALEWVFGFDGALACLELVANGGHWQQWQQHRTDTRGIVTERAGKYLRKLQAELASAKAEAGRLRAALEPFAKAANLMHAYDGQRYLGLDQYLPANQSVVDEAIRNDYGVGEITVSDLKQAEAALQAGTEGG